MIVALFYYALYRTKHKVKKLKLGLMLELFEILMC